jgi:nicotinamidase-related amidase
MQEKLLPAIADSEAVLANVIRLVRFAKIIQLPVIVSEQIKLGPTVAAIRAEIPDAEIIIKAEFDAIKNTDFAIALEALNRRALVVVGVEAHICVTQTILHALPRYPIHVVADAIGSRSLDNRNVAIERMRAAGATVTSTEMVIYELLEKGGTDEFRAVLELVKRA